ncbi:MAG: hypothetical protein QXY49_04450 [Thermofilaceae archaeon]
MIFAVVVSGARAQSATSQTWTSSITYYTPSSSGGTLQVNYYAGTNLYQGPIISLVPHKAGSLFIGTVSTVPDGFVGSAVLRSDVPVVATYVQFAAGAEAGNYGRPIYSGFSPQDAATPFYVPTVLYQKFNTTSRIGVQNVEDFEITALLKFYEVGNPTPIAQKSVDIPAQASYVFAPSEITGLTPGFNGSLVIEATKKGDPTTPGKVVAASVETADSGRFAYAFEGVAQGANKIYMPSMLCKYRPEQQMSYYAIQNAGNVTATVTIKFYNTAGAQVGTMPPTNIPPGGKISVQPCAYGVPENTSGSAVIESTGAPIIAIGKISANNGLATAFIGQSTGYKKVALPYVRWAANPAQDFRAYIAIMNVGDDKATNIVAKYYDGNGNLVATHRVAGADNPLGVFIKRNSDPYTAGALNPTYGDFGFHPPGGAVEIESDQPVVVVVRLARNVNLAPVTMFGEDYNGVPIP